VTAGTKRLAAAYLALSQRLSATTNMGSTATPYPINAACPLDERLLRKFLIAQFSILMGYVFPLCLRAYQIVLETLSLFKSFSF
jgi:hypothetical protein